jgi:hypothetical protein
MLVVRVVDAAVAPGIAAKEPPGCEHDPTQEAELTQRVEGVLGATGVVLAATADRLRDERADKRAVRADEKNRDGGQERSLRKTSPTRSISQGKPCPSTASPRPGLAMRT